MIFADRSGYGSALAQRLQAEGQDCLLVYAKDIYSADRKSGNWSLNSANPQDFQRLFRDLPFGKKSTLGNIVHCWNLDTDLLEDSSVSDLEKSQTIGCGSLLHLVRAIVADDRAILPKLWLVTRGAVAIDKEPINIAQASAWGFGKVISLEHPDIWGGAIDLDFETSTEKLASQTLLELEDNHREELLALRKEKRYVARLVRQNIPSSSKYKMDESGSYLITGGLGSLGLKIAQSLVQQGAKHLLLLGRHGLPEEEQWASLPKNSKSAKQVKIIQALKHQGAKITIETVDVAEATQMSALFDKLNRQRLAIKGVVHAAGVENNQFIQELDLQMLHSTLRPKVLGAWLLHQLTKNIELDFFVCFSSISSIWGSGKQASYAAANSFLDALAHYRQALELPGVSINWGPWTGGGMATEESQQLLSRVGVKSWQPNESTAIFTHLLNSDISQIVAAKINWDIFKEVYRVTKERPLFAEINLQQQEKVSALAQSEQLITQLRNLAPARRYDFLVNRLQQKVAETLGWSSSQLPGKHEGFAQLGMDSLTAVELKNNLEQDLGCSLSSTIAFNYPNTSDLANYLLAEVCHLGNLADSSEQIFGREDRKQNMVDDTSGLEAMSEDDLASLLDEELEHISDLSF